LTTFLIKPNDQLPEFSEYSVKANSTVVKRHRFLDFLKGGLKISLIVAIDFTGSNGEPSSSSSLHYISNSENSYEKAIRACATTVAYYDTDQLFPAYGYGGILPNTSGVNHCFNLNLQSDPKVQFVEGLLTAYKNAIKVVSLDGPTNFSPVIRNAITISKEGLETYTYSILLIITDGDISDLDDTKDALVDASFYPMSVIIIGVGSSSFGSMDVLDADTNPLVSRDGKRAQRDLVQFVPFNKFNDEKKLSEEVLAEVPRQVEDYYRINNLPPKEIV